MKRFMKMTALLMALLLLVTACAGNSESHESQETQPPASDTANQG